MQAAAVASNWLVMDLTRAAPRASQRLAAHATSTVGPLRPSAVLQQVNKDRVPRDGHCMGAIQRLIEAAECRALVLQYLSTLI